MKKSLFALILIAAMISCEKLSDLKVSEIIPSGCALDNKGSSKNGLTEEVNKVTYTFSSGNLNMFVGFNATCCGQYSTASEIKGDSILIRITTTQIGICNCICYYTYNFTFTGTGENYKYKVTVDNAITFSGKIKR